jgi:hypothetical protein
LIEQIGIAEVQEFWPEVLEHLEPFRGAVRVVVTTTSKEIFVWFQG